MTKRQLLDVIYNAVVNDPNADVHLVDPSGQLRYRVNQLMSGLSRDYELDDDFIDKVRQCQPIFGRVTI